MIKSTLKTSGTCVSVTVDAVAVAACESVSVVVVGSAAMNVEPGIPEPVIPSPTLTPASDETEVTDALALVVFPVNVPPAFQLWPPWRTEVLKSVVSVVVATV